MRDIEEIVARFRESGLKITPQRVSIFKLLQGNRDHPSAEDIYRQVLKVHPAISFTTVYKTLQTLRDMGELQELTINPERAHYDPATWEHVHTFCRSCRSICDLDDGHESNLTPFIAEAGSFEVHHVQIHLVGLCGECR
ncbi:MAG: Fur family transcriptional regulator [bacterium]|nr:Fur family transcriptional regulator [bacterium]MDT8396042.1 Fur family transcriptional regulator [bacterium]